MFCSKCGNKLPDNSSFCPMCGTKANAPVKLEPIPGMASAELPVTASEETVVLPGWQDAVTEAPARAKGKTNKRPLVIGAVAVAAVLVIAILAVLLGNVLSGSGADSATESYAIGALLDEDGAAYIPLPGGDFVKVDDEVKNATLTKDKKHLIVLLEDGTLYVTDPAQKEKHTIADDVYSIAYPRNDGLIYQDEDYDTYRVLFKDYSALQIDADLGTFVAEHNISTLYADDNGNVYSLAADSVDEQKIGEYDGTITLEGISDDGQLSVWVTEEDDVYTLVMNDGDEQYTLGEVDSAYNITSVTFSADQKLVVVANTDSDRIWIKAAGKEPVEARLGSDLYSTTIYTNKAELSDTNAKDVDSLYIVTEGDDSENIVRISLDGDRDRVISRVTKYYFANGSITYLTEDNALYQAKLNGADIEDEQKIASKVDTFEISRNGRYVYYLKNADESGSLYCYKTGAKESQKVSSDAACYAGYYASTVYVDISTDGKTVWFYEDVEEIEDTYADQGTLMMWTYGDESATRIATEVLVWSVNSFLDGYEVNRNDYVFMKFSSVDSDGTIYIDWMHHNGKEATRFAKNLIY